MTFEETVREFFGDLIVPLRALLVALVGALLARLWFSGDTTTQILVVVLGVVLATIGLGLERAGYALLPERPVDAVRLMEWWVATPAVFSALAAMIVVVASASLAGNTDATVETEKVIAAVAAALTAFLTSSFIDWAGDQDDSRTANRIRRQFYRKYERAGTAGSGLHDGVYYVPAGSTGERWVYSEQIGGISGWGRDARRERARNIAAQMELAQPTD